MNDLAKKKRQLTKRQVSLSYVSQLTSQAFYTAAGEITNTEKWWINHSNLPLPAC